MGPRPCENARVGVEATALTTCRAKPGGRGGLVLGYAVYSPEEIREGVKMLAVAME
jgi:hypothetical protein